MKKRTVVTFGVLAAALIGTAALWWMYAQCHMPVGRTAIKGSNSIGCFDFWLNRYQTLISGIAAVVAAIYAARFALKQLSIMASDAGIRRAQEIAELEDLVVDVWHHGFMVQSVTNKFATVETRYAVDDAVEAANEWIVGLSKLNGRVENAYGTFRGGPEISLVFKDMALTLRGIIQASPKIIGGAASAGLPLRLPKLETTISPDDVGKLKSAEDFFQSAGDKLISAADTARKVIGSNRDRLHAQLRDLDKHAAR